MAVSPPRLTPWQQLTLALVAASGLSLVVVASGLGHDSSLGAPVFLPWLLTGLQVLSLWSAGRRHWGDGWSEGSVQLPWIAYAVMTPRSASSRETWSQGRSNSPALCTVRFDPRR